MSTYKIHDSKTGNLLLTVCADAATVEALSSETAEGHFSAARLQETAHLGNVSVYAIESEITTTA